MANGWKDGVCGVEDPECPKSDIYKKSKVKRDAIEKEKSKINGRRKKDLFNLQATNSQINFGSS